MNEDRCICCGKIIPEGRHICLSCEHENEMQTFRLKTAKPKTNADMIRSMSDKELIHVVGDYVCRKYSECCPPCTSCTDCVRQWLRKEAGTT